MMRLGHSSSVAAMRYLHVVEGRDRKVADELGRLLQVTRVLLASEHT